MNWIPVTERLPVESRPWSNFLVVCRTHGGYDGGYRSIQKAAFYPDVPPDPDCTDDRGSTHFWEIEGAEMQQPFSVTHWMEMPALPEEKP